MEQNFLGIQHSIPSFLIIFLERYKNGYFHFNSMTSNFLRPSCTVTLLMIPSLMIADGAQVGPKISRPHTLLETNTHSCAVHRLLILRVPYIVSTDHCIITLY